MDHRLAADFAHLFKIAVEHVVRESYEMQLLLALFESRLGRALVFKGGTALRLAYGSPRFSDDLDFSLVAPVPDDTFVAVVKTVHERLPQVTMVEALAKRFTLFARFKVSEAYLPQPFSIKLEISTRPEIWERARDVELRLLASDFTNVTVLAQVATLERMWADKQTAVADRRQPRDLYDLWFITQKLRREFSVELAGFDRRAIRRELRKYLPQSHWGVIEQWTE
jgi:predicted nucleotidyltransferase component of viral defense system